jgi:hypothetical protein
MRHLGCPVSAAFRCDWKYRCRFTGISDDLGLYLVLAMYVAHSVQFLSHIRYDFSFSYFLLYTDGTRASSGAPIFQSKVVTGDPSVQDVMILVIKV